MATVPITPAGAPGAVFWRISYAQDIRMVLNHSFGYNFPWAATGGMDNKLIIWDLQHSLPHSTCDHEDGVTYLTWLEVSRCLATGCADGKVRLWDNLTRNCVRTFNGHSEPIQSLPVSANKDFLVSVSTDGTARVFEIEEYKQAIYPS